MMDIVIPIKSEIPGMADLISVWLTEHGFEYSFNED